MKRTMEEARLLASEIKHFANSYGELNDIGLKSEHTSAYVPIESGVKECITITITIPYEKQPLEEML